MYIDSYWDILANVDCPFLINIELIISELPKARVNSVFIISDNIRNWSSYC